MHRFLVARWKHSWWKTAKTVSHALRVKRVFVVVGMLIV